jgi:hypothetical protein
MDRASLLCCGRGALRRIQRDGFGQRQKFWQIAEDLRGRLRLPLESFDLRERVLQRGGAIAFASVGGVERLLLGRDRRLHAQAIVMLGEPSVKGHRGQEHGEQNPGDF